MYQRKLYVMAALCIMLLLCTGCVKKTVSTAPVDTTTPVVTMGHDEAKTPSTDRQDHVFADQKTMGDLKAGFKYIKASYAAILAGIDKIKKYDLGDYNTIIERVYPFLVQLGEAIDTYNDALNNTDDGKALTTYNVARSLITTILKIGGPLLIKMIF